MKNIIMSIQPKWVKKIISGEKTIEVRKTAPKETPFKVYIYCTKGGDWLYLDYEGQCKWSGGYHYNENNAADYYNDQLLNGAVIGEFVCDKVDKVINHGSGFSIFNESEAYTNRVARQSGLYFDDLKKYLETKDGYAWHITDLKVYDEPKELGEFYRLDDSGDDCCCGCIYHEIPMNEYPCCKCNGDRKYLTHAPQSYMRIQDTKEERK